MPTRNLVILVTLLLISLAPATLRAQATPAPLASYDWAVTASPNLTTHPPPVEDVRNFLEQTAFNGVSGTGAPVCSFRFADLRHDGKNLSLLVTLEDGGHGGCGSLSIVDRTATGFQMHDQPSGLFIFGIDDVNQAVRDIIGDGRLELIFDSGFTDYEGAGHCVASWPVIYGWDGKNYSYLSAEPRFRSFYEHEIKTLRSGIPDDCDQATIAKIQRFLGASPNIGIDEAIAWANSSDPLRREFAVGVLSDIGTPVAKKYLRMLTKDKNTSVAIGAKMEFAYRHFGKPAPEAKFLDGEDSTMQDQPATDETDQLAGAWQLLLPLTTGGKADPKSKARKWYNARGFDSKEQCEVGIQVMQQSSDDHAPLHGKCVPAPPR